MLRSAGFMPHDWNQAPTYKSPLSAPGAVVLDFEELSHLAQEEASSGAFRTSEDGTLAKAPLFIDDLPAAFYQVGANHPHFTPNHNTSGVETLVVMEGALRIVSNSGGGERTDDESFRGLISEGEVMELFDEAVSMQAVSLVDPAKCLALALYRDYDNKMRPDLKIL